MRNLFAPGNDDWRPNIPYVFMNNRNPGFTTSGAIPSYSGVDPGAIQYQNNGVGGRFVGRRPFAPSPLYNEVRESPYGTVVQTKTVPGLAKK